MTVKTGQSITVEFVTSHPTTQDATDADSTPTGTLYIDGTDNAASVTVTKIDTGRYKAAVTLPALTAGQVAGISIAATVNAVAGKAIVWQDVADTKRVSDLNDAAAGPSAATIAGAVLDEAKGSHAGLLAGVALDSTVAKSATALSNAVWTDAKSAHLDADISDAVPPATYWYRVALTIHNAAATPADEWLVIPMLGMAEVGTGAVTTPTLTVVDSAGNTLLSAVTLTEIGTTGRYKYVATGANRTTPGASYVATPSGTIAVATRTGPGVQIARDY